ncbi:MAG: FecR family protein [Thermodesulfobacteriota bacterium]
MHKTELKYVLVLSLIFVLPFLSAASSDKKAGKVVEIRGGKLERMGKGIWTQIFKGSGVLIGDRIRTDSNGLAVLELEGAGRFVVGPASEIELGKNETEFKTDLSRGALWLNAKLPKGKSGVITTSIATAGIRGTKFSVFYGRGTKDLCICTCEGMVEGTLSNGKTIQVPKGTILAVKGDAPLPEKPESAFWILEKKPSGYDFCFRCHIEGGKKKSESYWD